MEIFILPTHCVKVAQALYNSIGYATIAKACLVYVLVNATRINVSQLVSLTRYVNFLHEPTVYKISHANEFFYTNYADS